MKAIILILLLGISLSFDAEASLNYAKKHCCRNCYNSKYNNYAKSGGDCANFVSQCLYAGRQRFDGCVGRDDKGMFRDATNLITCLKIKGWKVNSKNFRAGHPFFMKDRSNVMLSGVSGGVNGNDIVVYSHSTDKCGDISVKIFNVYTFSP